MVNNGILFLALHAPDSTSYDKRDITGLSNQDGIQLGTFVQEWDQSEINELVLSCGFDIEYIRPFTREGGWYPLLSILAKKKV